MIRPASKPSGDNRCELMPSRDVPKAVRGVSYITSHGVKVEQTATKSQHERPRKMPLILLMIGVDVSIQCGYNRLPRRLLSVIVAMLTTETRDREPAYLRVV